MLKFGSETGSLVNHILSTSKVHIPEIGEGATILSWSDRNPATVVSIEKKRNDEVIIVGVQSDSYLRVDDNGLSEMQEYVYSPNPNGCVYHYRIDTTKPDAKWVRVWKSETGRWNKLEYGNIIFGIREKYHDFSF